MKAMREDTAGAGQPISISYEVGVVQNADDDNPLCDATSASASQ